MTKKFIAACIQNCATVDVEENIETCLVLAKRAIESGAELICTPEYFAGVETKNGVFFPAAFSEENHPVLTAFAKAARELGAWFLLGSLGVVNKDGKISNRSYLINSNGETVAAYNKIHLFDVDLEGGSYRESETISPGTQAVIGDLPWGRLGLSICYDLRFAALYRQLAKSGADILAVPAAFTKATGEAHWHVLNRARAIETGSYVIAPCQYGTLAGGGECYGHSLIIDPWGRVLADGGDKEGFVLAQIDPEQVAEARRKIPALNHDREIG